MNPNTSASIGTGINKMRQLKQHFRNQGTEEFKTFIQEFRALFMNQETTRKEAREIIQEKYKDLLD